MAKQERVRLSERIIAGLERARAKGIVGGRPRLTDDFNLAQRSEKARSDGKSIRAIAEEFDFGPGNVMKFIHQPTNKFASCAALCVPSISCMVVTS